MKHCTAVLGGGCFWCVEAVFSDLKGVLEVIPGYSGGHVENPTYEQVCTNETGHAEVVQITYDADQISYADLLKVFFSTHNPTTLNRQGKMWEPSTVPSSFSAVKRNGKQLRKSNGRWRRCGTIRL